MMLVLRLFKRGFVERAKNFLLNQWLIIKLSCKEGIHSNFQDSELTK